MKIHLYAVILGVLLGAVILVSPEMVSVIGLSAISIFLINRFCDETNRKFLVKIFIIGVSIRILLAFIFHVSAIAIHYKDEPGYINPIPERVEKVETLLGITDDDAYSSYGYHLLLYWKGYRDYYKEEDDLSLGRYNWGIHTYFHALVYSFFGFVPLALKFINCLFGALIAVIMYFLSRDLFGVRIAKWVYCSVMFFPSMFYWSLSNLKDPLVILLFCTIIWLTIKIQRRFSLWPLISALPLVVLFWHYKRDLIIPLLCMMIFIVTVLSHSKIIRLLSIFLIILLIMPLFLQIDFAPFLQRVISRQRGIVQTGGKIYRLYEDKFYDGFTTPEMVRGISPVSFTKSFAKGWAYFMMSPFLWDISSKSQLFGFLQMVAWYCVLFFAIPGALYGLRHRFRESMAVLFVIILMGSGFAMVEGNIGTAFRHRDMFTPLILMFAVLGVMNTFGLVGQNIRELKTR